MAFGLGLLRWPPETFWAATPRELAAAALAYGGAIRAPDRQTLGRLMATHPDAARTPDTSEEPSDGR